MKLAGGWCCELLIDHIVDGIVVGLAALGIEGFFHALFQPIGLGALTRQPHLVDLLHAGELLILDRQPAEPVGIILREGVVDRIHRTESDDNVVHRRIDLDALPAGFGQVVLGHPLDMPLHRQQTLEFLGAALLDHISLIARYRSNRRPGRTG
ncbi:hypothetical protein RHECNPAF_1760070 [Rhizobium etli CNPAF512]|nr:hypothetical protein RHECNPAF_1760070 [Rhizobium etli CNPAF512]